MHIFSQVKNGMSEKREAPVGVFYECVNCGDRIAAEQLAMNPEVKCQSCGYRVLRKVRPPVVKRVKAK